MEPPPFEGTPVLEDNGMAPPPFEGTPVLEDNDTAPPPPLLPPLTDKAEAASSVVEGIGSDDDGDGGSDAPMIKEPIATEGTGFTEAEFGTSAETAPCEPTTEGTEVAIAWALEAGGLPLKAACPLQYPTNCWISLGGTGWALPLEVMHEEQSPRKDSKSLSAPHNAEVFPTFSASTKQLSEIQLAIYRVVDEKRKKLFLLQSSRHCGGYDPMLCLFFNTCFPGDRFVTPVPVSYTS